MEFTSKKRDLLLSAPLARIFDDEAHSSDEQREIIIGHSRHGRLLLVCFTERAGVIASTAHGRQLRENEEIMKRTQHRKPRRPATDEMRPEYRFDYRKARPNRFAGRLDQGRLMVVLDPDVSEVFSTPEAVNAALRAIISAIPARPKPRRARV